MLPQLLKRLVKIKRDCLVLVVPFDGGFDDARLLEVEVGGYGRTSEGGCVDECGRGSDLLVYIDRALVEIRYCQFD
jgi:hypothetical protein